MSRIENDVQQLMSPPEGLTLLDGLLLGAVVGAAGAALVIVTRAVVTRRLARRIAVDGTTRARLAGEGSPL